MKVMLKISLFVICGSALMFSKGVDSGVKKTVKSDSSVIMFGSVKYSQGYGEFGVNDGAIERKRSHKRRKATRKPRRGRGQ